MYFMKYNLLAVLFIFMAATETLAYKPVFITESFENGLSEWVVSPKPRKNSETYAKIDSRLSSHGSSSARISVANSEKKIRFLTQRTVKGDVSYRFSFQYYTRSNSGSGGRAWVRWLDENGRRIGDTVVSVLPGTANIWVEREQIVQSPSHACSADIIFEVFSTEILWLDEVKFSIQTGKRSGLALEEKPLFNELLISGSEPAKLRFFPYWGYNSDAEHYRKYAMIYGWPYSLEQQYRQCAQQGLAPLSGGWMKHPEMVESQGTAITYSLTGNSSIYNLLYKQKRILTEPEVIQAILRSIEKQNFPSAPKFCFLFDELFLLYSNIPDQSARTSNFWVQAEEEIKQRYGFGKFGMPDDESPYRWISYLRWQAEKSSEMIKLLSQEVRKRWPEIIILGPDEHSTFCPLDYERIGDYIDIQTGQTLATMSGYRQYNSGYMVKFYRDLTQKPVYPYIQVVKYGPSPSVETVYKWVDYALQNGAEGLFVGAVEWFDRTVNHPQYTAPTKWSNYLSIIKQLRSLPRVRRPEDSSVALHFSSFTQMSRGRMHLDKKRLASAYAILGPKCRSWFTFTDDFQLERDPERWEKYKVVVMPDCQYISESMQKTIQRFVANGGTLIVTDPKAFFNRIDGESLNGFREELFGVRVEKESPRRQIKINNQTFNISDNEAYKLKIMNPERVTVTGEYLDKSPAIIMTKLGKGKVWYFACQTSTGEVVDSPKWIKQWKKWLTELDIPLNLDIWRFQLPRSVEPVSQKNYCATGNAIVFKRNYPDVSMNLSIPGTYSYDIPPKGISEKNGSNKILFSKGFLTNRRRILDLKTDSCGRIRDETKLNTINWVVRFDTDQLEPNAITFDIKNVMPLTMARICFSGTLPPATVQTSINGRIWKNVGTSSLQFAEQDVSVVTYHMDAAGRYVKLKFDQRPENTLLTLAEIDIWSSRQK